MARETLPSLARRSALAGRTALVTGASGAFGPDCYARVGLDPKQARRAARRNPHWRASKIWYLDAAGRNVTLWPDFTCAYARQTRRFDAASYDVVLPHPQ